MSGLLACCQANAIRLYFIALFCSALSLCVLLVRQVILYKNIHFLDQIDLYLCVCVCVLQISLRFCATWRAFRICNSTGIRSNQRGSVSIISWPSMWRPQSWLYRQLYRIYCAARNSIGNHSRLPMSETRVSKFDLKSSTDNFIIN